MKSTFLSQVKLTALFLFTTTILLIKNSWILISLFGFEIILILILKPRSKLRERIWPLSLIGLSVVLFQLIFNTSISVPARIVKGITTATKILALSLGVFLFTLFTSLSEIINLLSFLPKRIQLMLTITFSMIPVIIQESQKILLAQRNRGFTTSSFNILKNIVPIIIPLLHRTLRHAEQIAMVIQAKGYNET